MNQSMIIGIYVASVLGAIAVLLLMPRRTPLPRVMGVVLGGATLGGLWLYLARYLPGDGGMPSIVWAYQYIFSAIAIISAVIVITHRRPVFSALWFIMTVLASAGLLLLLSAEFMAFAMVIIYGGAILVTYVFVIMLAAQDPSSETITQGDPAELDAKAPEHDRVAREPVAAVVVGFVLLAAILTASFQPMQPNPQARAEPDAVVLQTQLSQRPGLEMDDQAIESGSVSQAMRQRESVYNTERVGLDLFEAHPLGLELAGVILLVALIGAVVIARQKVFVAAGDDPQVDASGGRP